MDIDHLLDSMPAQHKGMFRGEYEKIHRRSGHVDINRLVYVKGGPLEKEIHEILGSKREDRFSDPFFDWLQNTSLIRFSYLLRLCNFCEAPWDIRKFPGTTTILSLSMRSHCI